MGKIRLIGNHRAASTLEASSVAAAFRQQESLLILLNIVVLAALVGVQVIFRKITDLRSFELVLTLFFLRIAEQTVELLWLRKQGVGLSEVAVRRYAKLSIAANVLFAAAVSLAANNVDAHYSVLLVLPLIAAAFRLSLPGVLGIVVVSSMLAFLEVFVYFVRNPPMVLEEYFEAATVSLVYVVVGLVVFSLVRQMRENASSLRSALDELGRTRDRLVAEERLSAVGRLSSAIAHEIRNPVAIISGALQTAAKAGVSDEIRTEFTEIAARESARLERVTGDFLSYARTKPPEKAPMSSRETLEYLVSLMKAKQPEGGPEVGIAYAEEFTLRADAFQIHQALMNVLLNAVEHTPPDGCVALFASEKAGVCEFAVENSGEPVRETPGTDIFEPFYTTRQQGTGLGLPISRNIARAHGGDLILAKNERGAVKFVLTIPKE